MHAKDDVLLLSVLQTTYENSRGCGVQLVRVTVLQMDEKTCNEMQTHVTRQMASAAVAVVHIAARWMPHGAKEVVAGSLTVKSPLTCKASLDFAKKKKLLELRA
jgi:hypothetical protein